MKVVIEKESGPILGVHMVGPHVTELIGEATLMFNWEATLSDASGDHPPPPDPVGVDRRGRAWRWRASRCTPCDHDGGADPMASPVTMPQLGETVVEGTITRWLKKEGEHVDRDEPLFEISTDKVDTEVPSPLAGTIVARSTSRRARP